MRVDAPDLAEAAHAAVPSLYRPYPRYRSAVTGVGGARLLPTPYRQPLEPGRFRNAFASGIANWIEMGTRCQKDQ